MSFLNSVKDIFVRKGLMKPPEFSGGEYGIRREDLSAVRSVDAVRVGVYDSDVENVERVSVGGRGMDEENISDFEKGSFVFGILDSVVDYVGKVGSTGSGIRSSDVDYVGEIVSKDWGISVSDIGYVERVFSESMGVYDSDVDGIGAIKSAERGVSQSSVGKVGRISSGSTAIYGSDVESVGSIISGSSGIANSKVGSVDKIMARQNGVRDSDVEHIGSVKADRNGLQGCSVETVGEVVSGAYGISDSDVGKVGEIMSVRDGVRSSDGVFVDGSIVRMRGSGSWYAFSGSDMCYMVGEKVSGHGLDRDSYGGLVAVREFDVDVYNEGMTLITPDDEGMNFKGDWDRLDKVLSSDRNFLKYLQVFPVSEGSFSSVEELKNFDESLGENISVEFDVEEMVDEAGYIGGFSFLDIEEFGGMVDSLVNSFERKGKRRVERFGEFLDGVEEVYVDEVVNSLVTGRDEHSVGRDLFEIGRDMDALDFVEKEDIERFLEGSVSSDDVYELLMEEQDFFDDGSRFGDMYGRIVEEYKDELSKLFYRAESAGISPSFPVLKELKGCEGMRRRKGFVKELDMEELFERMEEDVENRMREYTKRAMKELGENCVKDCYEEIVGERPDDVDSLSHEVLKAWKKYGKNNEAAEKLLREGDEVYEEDENRNWLEGKDFGLEELTGFETGYIDVDVNVSRFRSRRNGVFERMADIYRTITGSEDVGGLEEIESFYSSNKGSDNSELFAELSGLLDEYNSILEKERSVPERINVRVASPMESINMGNYFSGSCLGIGKSNGWGAVSNAVDVNKQVLYAEDEEGEVVGRVLTALNEDGSLSSFRVYTVDDYDIRGSVNEGVRMYAESLGLDVVDDNKNVDELVAEEWYSSAI